MTRIRNWLAGLGIGPRILIATGFVSFVAWIIIVATGNGDILTGPVGALFLALLFGVPYFIPAIVAVLRKTDHAPAIVLLNFFLGWTFIGWVAALVWAVAAPGPKFVGVPALPPGWTALPPAGFYPDPAGLPTRRYWDGRQWTSATV